jgi:hypothetical protein
MDTTATDRRESDLTLLVSGLVVVLLGGFTLCVANGLGYVASFVIAAAYLLFAWRVDTSARARALRLLVAGFGIVAFASGFLGVVAHLSV